MAVNEESDVPPRILNHELYRRLVQTRDYLAAGDRSGTVNLESIPKLIKDLNQKYGVDLPKRFLGAMSNEQARGTAAGHLKYAPVKAAIQIIEELALIEVGRAQNPPNRIVRIDDQSTRETVNSVTEALINLEECLSRSNAAGSEVGFSELQRQVLIAALKAMIKQLEGPVADRRLIGEFQKSLDGALSEGVRKGVSEIVTDAIKSARDKLVGLCNDLASKSDGWPSLNDIFDKS